MKELNVIQTGLNAPKTRFNSFFNGNYRSAEDIMEALKPLLKETGCTVVCSDELAEFGGRLFVRATSTITNASGESVSATAYAELRDGDQRDKLDPAQRTGSASSYARKYAMGGLFAIDDSRDPDDEGMSRIREEERSRNARPPQRMAAAPKAATKASPNGDDGLPTSTAIFNSLVEAEARGRLTKDGRQPREWFEKRCNATIPQMRIFDDAVEELRLKLQRESDGADKGGKVEIGDSPNADEIFDND